MYPLITHRLSIEPLEFADIEAFVAYRQDPLVARWQGWSPDYSHRDAETLVRTQTTEVVPAAGDWLQLGVHTVDGTTLLGDVAIHRLPDQPDTFEMGMTFDRRHQGRGFATEAVRRLLQFLFVDHHAHRIVASCDARNEPVQALLQRCGFRLESQQIEADFFKDEWTSLYGYALLRREFAPAGD
ncbi:MAG: GNAT family N-acetyltransferase [Nakamurella sp.]